MRTRLTDAFDLTHPITSAPMAFAAGGRLAAAVSHAGGLGLTGGGYGNADWLEAAFAEAGNARVGVRLHHLENGGRPRSARLCAIPRARSTLPLLRRSGRLCAVHP